MWPQALPAVARAAGQPQPGLLRRQTESAAATARSSSHRASGKVVARRVVRRASRLETQHPGGGTRMQSTQ